MAGELRHRRVPPEDGDGDEGVVASSQRLDSASSSAADGNGKAGTSSGGGGGGGEGVDPRSGKRDALGWLEWGRGWMAVVGEFLFQRIAASHLANPLELPPLDGVSIVVTGATSGIGLEIARCLPAFPPPSSPCFHMPTPQDVMDGSFSRPLRFACSTIGSCSLFMYYLDSND
jgi:hypothetical protein